MSTALDARQIVEDALSAAGCSNRGNSWDCPVCCGKGKLGKLESAYPTCFVDSCAGHAGNEGWRAILDSIGVRPSALHSGSTSPVSHVDGQIGIDDAPTAEAPAGEFTDASVQALTQRAIPAGRAEVLGILPVRSAADLPEELRWAWDGPGMVIEWRDHDRTVPQYRPDAPAKIYEGEKEPRKYLFPKGAGSPLNWLREPAGDEPVLIVEGALKGPSVAAWAPEGYGVAAIISCDGWKSADLTWAEERSVVVAFDADTATNARVWQAGTDLREALLDEGATAVKFLRANTARAKQGIDDVLGGRSEDKRTGYLQRLIDRSTDKLGARPAAKKSASKGTPDPEEVRRITDESEAEGRKPVTVNMDPLEVITNLVKGMKTRDGKGLFNHGGALSEYDAESHAMAQVNQGRFCMVLAETSRTVRLERDGSFTPAWPDSNTLKATFSRGNDFSKVRRVMRAPFVRADGTICTEPGYDRVSQTYADFPADLTVDVPEAPTPQQIEAALALILDDWWGDLAFPEETDRSNALALLLTPFVRDSINVVPLAVVDGLQMGSGKNLFADVCSIVYCGSATTPQPLPEADDEVRKQITATLRQAPATVVFDEAHTIGGKSLAQVLTAETWGDRVLGVSDRIALPNVATWISLGNNVQINGDMQRRYYPIRLHPTGENPQNRATSTFRHPDLKAWTTEHRAALLTAVLTLIRAWHAEGRQYVATDFSLGSFERWQRTLGGILQTAGRKDFLEGLQRSRSESDVVGSYWDEHLSWLWQQFNSNAFRAADVKRCAVQSTLDYLPPPGLTSEVSDSGYSRDLGNAYRRIVGQVRNGIRVVKAGQGHNNVAMYALENQNATEGPPGGGSGGSGGSTNTFTQAKTDLMRLPTPDVRTHMRNGGREGFPTPPTPPTPPRACSCSGVHTPQDPFCPANTPA